MADVTAYFSAIGEIAEKSMNQSESDQMRLLMIVKLATRALGVLAVEPRTSASEETTE